MMDKQIQMQLGNLNKWSRFSRVYIAEIIFQWDFGREQKTGKWGNHFLFRISVGILEQSIGARRNQVRKGLSS
jgi:hypothetical protein